MCNGDKVKTLSPKRMLQFVGYAPNGTWKCMRE